MSRDLRFWGLVCFIFVVTIAGTAAYITLTAPLSIKLRLGADQHNSEPYEMASAIAHVVGRSYPGIRIEVISTGGSSENMSLLAKGRLNLVLVLSSLVVLYSLGLAFTRRLAERQKGRIEDYAGELLELEKAAKGAMNIPELDIHKLRLTAILAEAVNDMREHRINAEGLQLFTFVRESVNYTINDHEEQLRLGPEPKAVTRPGETALSQ